MNSRRSGAGPSPAVGSSDDILVIATRTPKGGTGKTTHTVMLGAMLAKEGHTTILVDADPQQSVTSFFAEDKMEEPEEPSSDAEGEESEAEEAEVEEEVDLEALLGRGSRQLVLPPLPGDRLRKADAMPADVMHGISKWCKDKDNLYDVLRSVATDKHFVATPTPVNTDDYGGRLLLLPGSPQLSDYSHDLERTATTMMAGPVYGAFGKAMRDMAKRAGASFVVVDLGPHNDMLHQVILTSCDAVGMVVDACTYTVYSTFNMLHTDLPKWIKWFKEFAPAHKTGPYAYNQRFPRLLPFVGFGYEMKKSYVQWSASNLFETMRQTIEGESIGGDTQRLPPEVKALYVPCAGRGTKPTQMLVPFIRHLKYLAVAEECGRPFFDLSDKNLQDYYHNSVQELEMGKLEAEMVYVEQRYRTLARNIDLLRRVLAVQRKAEKEASRKGKKGKSGKKRAREQEGASGSGGSGQAGPSSRRAQSAGRGAEGAGRGGAQPAGAARRKAAAPRRVSPPAG